MPQMTLDELAECGYIIDEWADWQQGMCGTYALALLQAHPHLRLGGVDFNNDPGFDNPGHFVAHDDEYAYDSAGRHPLPYQGVHGDGRWLADLGDPADYGIPDDETDEPAVDLQAARDHHARHQIVTRPPATAPRPAGPVLTGPVGYPRHPLQQAT